ncbi:MAG: Tetrahydromethanopterin:alpha-L-glutamate ligase [Candidatus Argoarchaeum ethanivorans]|uniref:Tetrahydromethanopterin:alpha-L-glutamate ligase n=1 Tax=Candidatus Argoarchaeum ethanivorans TaxID=2608793 RepID=A0A811TFH4_9EURY|nr:MAG: Tetrahydromethanopterin:alpha-L-glutamate ligase [Candidatus Argoarchaeum ethanivorans]
MKNIGIVVTDPSDWTALSFISNVKAQGMRPVIIQLSKAISDINHINCDGRNLADLDGLLVRDVGSGGLESTAFRFDLLLELERSGMPVINPPSAIQLAANKHLSYWKLKRAGLPLPKTCVTSSVGEAASFVREAGCAVAKPIFGYKGYDVELIKEQQLHRIEEIIRERGVIYLQEFITHGGRDTRVFVVEGKAIGAIYRVAQKGSWINNLSRGGIPQSCTLTKAQQDISVKAASALGSVYAGVDLVEDEKNTFVLEVNGTPSGYGLYQALGINAAQYIVEALLKELDCALMVL